MNFVTLNRTNYRIIEQKIEQKHITIKHLHTNTTKVLIKF